MPVARLPPQIALSGESATTVTERSREYLWLAPGRSLLLRLFVSSILRFSEDVWFLHACKIECLLPQSPLMGGPRVGATSNPLPGFERRGPGSTCPWGPATFIRTDHRTQQPSIGRRRSTGPFLDINIMFRCHDNARALSARYISRSKPQVWTSERRVGALSVGHALVLRSDPPCPTRV